MRKYPATSTIPAYYELGIKDVGTLLVRIHESALNFIANLIKEDSPIIQGYREEFPKAKPFDPFILPQKNIPWGFGEILVPAKSKEKNWLVYESTLPPRAKSVLALRSTLSILFTALELFEGETDSKRDQLMVIDNLVVANREYYAGGLSVILTPTVAKWLSKKPEHFHLAEVEKAMMNFDVHMHPDINFGKLHKYEFQASCQGSRWINFQVPGNACGLDPENYYSSDSDTGYRLSPHNTDSSAQQLTLLVGLAKLQDIVREG